MSEFENRILSTIYKNRIKDEESRKWYKDDINIAINHPYTIDELYDYIFKIPDIDKAADILFKHIKSNSVIFFCIDLDHDGCSSGVVASLAIEHIFNKYQPEAHFIISSRKHARGFNNEMLTKIDAVMKRDNITQAVIVTADMGTGDEINYSKIKELYPNVDIIVTDHHTVTENYPKSADALVNVHREESKLDKCICGCVTLFFLLVMTKYKETKIQYQEQEFIDTFIYLLPYACTSTLVDNMSVKYPINRYLIKLGLGIINSDFPERNFDNFRQALRLPEDISYRDISMSIGPLINTGNRLGFEKLTLHSLITKDDNKAREYLYKLLNLSNIRKKIVSQAMDTVLITNRVNEYPNCSVVTHTTNTYIAGNIANNLTQMVNRPVICFNDTGTSDSYIGSARSVNGIKLLPIVKEMANDHPEMGITAQGHNGAFGCSVYKIHLDKFKKMLNDKLSKVTVEVSDIEPELFLKHEELTMYTADIINKLAPYGLDWEYPIATTEPMTVAYLMAINTFYIIGFELSTGEKIEGMHFFRHVSKQGINFHNFRDMIRKNQKVKLIFQLHKRYYRGQYSPTLEIIDIEPIYS